MIITPVLITDSATVLPFPPTAIGWIPDGWNDDDPIERIFLEWSAALDTDITLARLYGLRLVTIIIADFVFTATHGTETFTKVAHTLKTGVGPLYVSNAGGGLPAGLDATIPYYAIRVDADNYKLALSRVLAYAGTAVEITTNGTGTHTLSDSQPGVGVTLSTTLHTHRVEFDSYGLLGQASDGSFSVSEAGLSYVIPARHKTSTIGYAVSATLSATNAQRIQVRPEVL